MRFSPLPPILGMSLDSYSHRWRKSSMSSGTPNATTTSVVTAACSCHHNSDTLASHMSVSEVRSSVSIPARAFAATLPFFRSLNEPRPIAGRWELAHNAALRRAFLVHLLRRSIRRMMTALAPKCHTTIRNAFFVATELKTLGVSLARIMSHYSYIVIFLSVWST
jgi:hypothetical protein